MPTVRYRRTVRLGGVPEGRRIIHFGTVDYECRLWVNGKPAGSHKDGYASPEFDITELLMPGDNALAVCALDDQRSGRRPVGKQCRKYRLIGCSYTRTTGIWQTVWLKTVPEKYLHHARVIPQAIDGVLDAAVAAMGAERGDSVRLTAYYEGRRVDAGQGSVAGKQALVRLQVSEKHLWFPLRPALYDLTVELIDGGTGQVADTVGHYFGLGDITLSDRALMINGRPVFMRTAPDQGFNPKGVYAAPDDAFLA